MLSFHVNAAELRNKIKKRVLYSLVLLRFS